MTRHNIQELYTLERLSGGDTCVHRLNPAAKLFAAAVFVVTVVSFDRYAFGRLIPYIFYPTLLMSLSETPYKMLLKRFLPALPFCLLAGISNIFSDKTVAYSIGGLTVSGGVISFFSILFRSYLCVMAVLILVSVTRLSELTGVMRRLRVPYIFVAMLEMTYRYIGVLFEEAYSMHVAYSLRSAGAKGIEMRDMGVFTGQLLLRGIDRAGRVYDAMKCRGYALDGFRRGYKRLSGRDVAFLTLTCSLCIAFRLVDVNALFARAFGGPY